MNINYLNFNGTTKYNQSKVPYISFTNFDKLGFITHGFSTRLGGVSKNEFESMNLSYTRGDDNEKVNENFRRIGKELNISPENMVYAMQTHTSNVMAVTEHHRGMGVVKERDFSDIDGLITNIPNVALVTGYADCVPLFFADPVKKVIGASHSGWRGTVKNIAKVTVDKMKECYDCNPADIRAFIGPSICKSCYEVGEDVAEEFAAVYKEETFNGILMPKTPYSGKYMLNLHRANYINFINSGLLPENIMVTDICTCCNPKLLFSHRASDGKRGGMCGFIQINNPL